MTPPEELEMVMYTLQYPLDGSTMTVVGESEQVYDGVDELPSDAPAPDDSDQIQC